MPTGQIYQTDHTSKQQPLYALHAEDDLLTQKQDIEDSLRRKKSQLSIKRLLDVLISLVCIILLLPVLLFTALLIKLTSKGDIFYSNDRIGYRGKHFRCYKFRSMVSEHSPDNKDLRASLFLQQNGILYKEKNDQRITKIGSIIRKTSIDEIPQFLNVLKNDMSLVGPRPLLPFMLQKLPEFTEVRSMVKPGITGLWQIKARHENTSAHYMIEYDVAYVKNFNLIADIKILLLTPFTVLKGFGAH